jgi:hypothetical protein
MIAKFFLQVVVDLAEVRERNAHLPQASADFEFDEVEETDRTFFMQDGVIALEDRLEDPVRGFAATEPLTDPRCP